uniref:Uncharacterized protein n=1 Tax=Moorena producens (strain JHB) TaxID=1454205 RepID=A0A1D9FV11_MOOP1
MTNEKIRFLDLAIANRGVNQPDPIFFGIAWLKSLPQAIFSLVVTPEGYAIIAMQQGNRGFPPLALCIKTMTSC